MDLFWFPVADITLRVTLAGWLSFSDSLRLKLIFRVTLAGISSFPDSLQLKWTFRVTLAGISTFSGSLQLKWTFRVTLAGISSFPDSLRLTCTVEMTSFWPFWLPTADTVQENDRPVLTQSVRQMQEGWHYHAVLSTFSDSHWLTRTGTVTLPATSTCSDSLLQTGIVTMAMSVSFWPFIDCLYALDSCAKSGFICVAIHADHWPNESRIRSPYVYAWHGRYKPIIYLSTSTWHIYVRWPYQSCVTPGVVTYTDGPGVLFIYFLELQCYLLYWDVYICFSCPPM